MRSERNDISRKSFWFSHNAAREPHSIYGLWELSGNPHTHTHPYHNIRAESIYSVRKNECSFLVWLQTATCYMWLSSCILHSNPCILDEGLTVYQPNECEDVFEEARNVPHLLVRSRCHCSAGSYKGRQTDNSNGKNESMAKDCDYENCTASMDHAVLPVSGAGCFASTYNSAAAKL